MSLNKKEIDKVYKTMYSCKTISQLIVFNNWIKNIYMKFSTNQYLDFMLKYFDYSKKFKEK